jgi:uncharacterized protein YndB with AHSA1/START domain
MTRTHVHEESFTTAPERLFAVLVTPSAAREWWNASRVIIHPEPGGFWVAAWGDEDAPDYVGAYDIAAIEPPRRLVLINSRYHARREGPLPFDADFTVTFEVIPDGEATRLRVTQAGFPDEPEADAFLAGCVTGWTETFKGIRRVVEAHG